MLHTKLEFQVTVINIAFFIEKIMGLASSLSIRVFSFFVHLCPLCRLACRAATTMATDWGQNRSLNFVSKLLNPMENFSSRRGVPLFVSRGLEVLPIMQRIKVCASFKSVNITFFVVGVARRFSLDCCSVHGYNSLLCTQVFAYHLFMLKGQCKVRF